MKNYKKIKYFLLVLTFYNISNKAFSQEQCNKADAGPDRILCKPCLENKGGDDCDKKTDIGSLDPEYDCCGIHWEPEDNLDDPKQCKTKASPEKTTTYTLTAKSEDFSFKGTDEMEVIVADITLEFNGDDINDEIPETWIGKRIDLEAKVEPKDLNVTAYKWEIGGLSNEYAIKDFIKSANSPTIEKLEPDDLNNESVRFYWWKGKENYKVSCEVTIELDGKEYKCRREAEIKVKTPTFTINSTVTGPIGQGMSKGVYSLCFGLINDNDPPGISFSVSKGSDNASCGKIEFWQKIYIRRSLHHASNGHWYNANYNINDNAVAFPYPKNGGSCKTQDSPSNALPLPANQDPVPKYDSLIVCDRFELWLMYKPSIFKAIEIPIQRLEWNWGAKAAWDVNTQQWIDYDHVLPAAFIQGNSINSLDEFPQWSDTWTNLQIAPDELPILLGQKEICNQ